MDHLSWLLDVVEEAKKNSFTINISETENLTYTLLQYFYRMQLQRQNFSIVVRQRNKRDYLMEYPIESFEVTLTELDKLMFRSLNKEGRCILDIILVSSDEDQQFVMAQATVERVLKAAAIEDFVPERIVQFINEKLKEVENINPKLKADYGWIFDNAKFVYSEFDVVDLYKKGQFNNFYLYVDCDEIEGFERTDIILSTGKPSDGQYVKMGFKRFRNFFRLCYTPRYEQYNFNLYLTDAYGNRVLLTTLHVPSVFGLIYFTNNFDSFFNDVICKMIHIRRRL